MSEPSNKQRRRSSGTNKGAKVVNSKDVKKPATSDMRRNSDASSRKYSTMLSDANAQVKK